MIKFVLFVSGASLMTLELTVSRILSPHLGSSIYVWTAIIGVIMAALSFGYYWGGKLADRKLDKKNLANIAFATGLSILFCYASKNFVLHLIPGFFSDLRVSSVVVTLILFAIPSFLFGTITPYATRLMIEKVNGSGEVVGTLYAISTLGSIAGTFMTGYVFLGYFGSDKILILLSVAMVSISALIDPNNFFKIKKLLLLAFFCALVSNAQAERLKGVIYETDSNYQKIYVIDTHEPGSNRAIRMLRTSVLFQSGKYLDSDEPLFEYIEQLSLVNYFAPKAKNYLFIGGGGYSLPAYLVNKYPEIAVDVVEIDPEITRVAKDYFAVPQKSIITYNVDGRSFVNKINKKYDVIVLDAYRDEIVMPFELTTYEAVNKYWDLLDENGILAVNIISALEGPKSQFLKAQYNTLKAKFSQILIFQAKPERRTDQMQNIVVFAFKNKTGTALETKDPNYQKLLNNLCANSMESDLPVLTDDFAPVEKYARGTF